MTRAAIFDTATGVILQISEGSTKGIVDSLDPGRDAIVVGPDVTDSGFYVKGNVAVPYPAKPLPVSKWDPKAEQWIDPRTPVELKDAQWEVVKATRTKTDASGFTWDGSTFDSDPASQARIQGGVLMALVVGDTFTMDWTLADNTVRTLSKADMIAVGLAMGAHVSAAYTQARIDRDKIYKP